MTRPNALLIASCAAGLFLLNIQTARSSIRIETGQLGTLFLSTETVQIPLSCDGNAIRWKVIDYFGTTVANGDAVPQNKHILIQPSLSTVGYFDLILTELRDGAETSTIATSFAIITPIDIRPMADSPFGAMTHFAQYNDHRLLLILARAGIAHFRDEQYWSAIEEQRNVFHYPTTFTEYMAKAAASSMTPLVPLTWSNRFYDFDNGTYTAPYTDSGRQGYANYALSLLARYPKQIHELEVWNEYNAGTFIKGPATSNKPYYYYLMLRSIHEAVQSRYPLVKVIAGATVPIAHGFFKSLFDQGAMPYLDAVSIHPYRDYPDGVNLEIAELRALVKKYNSGQEKPIWATEFSLSASNEGDRYRSAAYLAQIVTLMLSANVERMYYYLAMDDKYFPFRGLVGTIYDDRGWFRPHPPLVAYATLIRQLYGATYQSRFSSAPSTYAFRFRRDTRQVTVLWSNRPVTVSLASNSELTVTDIVGGTSTMVPVAGKLSITLNANVQYVWGPVTLVTEVDNDLLADSVSGYSKNAGENGWFYGYAVVGSGGAYDPSQFAPMAWEIWGADNYRWVAPGGYPFASGSQMHPSRAVAIRRWLSNTEGLVSVAGALSRGGGGNGVGVRIFVDRSEIYNQHLSPGQSLHYSVNNVSVTVGSTIDFVLDSAGNSDYDATNFTSTIFLQSSPPTSVRGLHVVP